MSEENLVAAQPQAASTERDFVLTRLIPAPRPLVFRAWTTPEHLERWFAPQGFTCSVQADVRVGGAYSLVMHGPDGLDYPMTGVYQEVVEPERLVFTQNISGQPAAWFEQLNAQRKPEDGPAPLEWLLAVTFAEQGAGTYLTITTHFDSPATRVAMEKMQMAEGWNMSLDQLEALVATLS
jgi:uncharacterized protein YndB with AHSA1/START domain